jgi:hypothetical protein
MPRERWEEGPAEAYDPSKMTFRVRQTKMNTEKIILETNGLGLPSCWNNLQSVGGQYSNGWKNLSLEGGVASMVLI